MERFFSEVKDTLKEVFYTVFVLLRIIIPISIIVKILKEFGVIEVIGRFLAPVMKIVGLPGESGLIWATALVTNIYGGVIALFSMVSECQFTVAQITILCSMILVAHALPVELRIAQKAGVRLWFTFVLRISGAFILGVILNSIYGSFNFLQQEVVMRWKPAIEEPTLVQWIIRTLKGYGLIFLIILVLISVIRILKALGVIERLNRLLSPFLRAMGMSKDAAPLTIIGIVLGISYGGGLIIKEAMSGLLSRRDVFLSLSLMCLSHSLIEDTLLMVTVGASLTGILLGRVIFTIAAMFILIKIVNRISDYKFNKFLVRPLPSKTT